MSSHCKSSPRYYNIADPSKSYCETRLKSKSIECTFDNMSKACCKGIVSRRSLAIDCTVGHLMAIVAKSVMVDRSSGGAQSCPYSDDNESMKGTEALVGGWAQQS